MREVTTHRGNYSAQTLSGNLIPIEINSSAIFSFDGTRIGYVGVIRDMSDWEKTLQSLKYSEAQYRAIVEDNPEMIVRFTRGGKVTFANQAYANYYSLKVEDLIGNNLQDVLPESSQPTIQMILKFVSPEMQPAVKEISIHNANNDTTWIRWKTRAILDDNGRIDRISVRWRRRYLREESPASPQAIRNVPARVNGIDQTAGDHDGFAGQSYFLQQPFS